MSKQSERRSNLAQRQHYAELVKHVRLLSVRLMESNTKTVISYIQPGRINTSLNFHTSYDPEADVGNRFLMSASLKVTFSDGDSDNIYGTVYVKLGLQYESKADVDANILQLFAERNVPVNAWPYLREHVQSMTTRFGWNPFVLPPYTGTSQGFQSTQPE